MSVDWFVVATSSWHVAQSLRKLFLDCLLFSIVLMNKSWPWYFLDWVNALSTNASKPRNRECKFSVY